MEKSLLIFCFAFFVLGCSDSFVNFEEGDCQSCRQEAEETLELIVSMSNAQEAKPIRVYAGLKEENNILFQDTVNESTFKLEVDADKYYSVEVEYQYNGKKLLVLDGSDAKFVLVNHACPNEQISCYLIDGNEFNMTIQPKD